MSDGALLLTVQDVADLLSVSPATIYRRRSAELIPAPVKIGTTTRWRKQELVEWIRADCPPQRTWRWPGKQHRE